MSNVPLAGEDFSLDKYRDMEPLQMMLAIRRDLEFKMPPIGVTKHRLLLAGKEYERTTWRCDKPGCWYICTPRDDSSLELLQASHYRQGSGDNCPTPPRRESLPSGLAEIEKLWREVDDVVDAMKARESFRGMEGAELQAYVKGLAFSIVMKDTAIWPNIKAVATQALKRWKMRKEEIPWEATPTRHENDYTSVGTQGGWSAADTTVRNAPVAPKPRKALKAAIIKLPADKVAAIKSALASGMFEPQDIALMYGVTVQQVSAIN